MNFAEPPILRGVDWATLESIDRLTSPKKRFRIACGEMLGTRQSGDVAFRLASPEQIAELIAMATDDTRLLVDRDGGLAGPRGQAARIALYLFERDAAVGLLKAG